MNLPVCLECGKQESGARAKKTLKMYQSMVDDWNLSAQRRYDGGSNEEFLEKNSFGGYSYRLRIHPKKTIGEIIRNIFFEEN